LRLKIRNRRNRPETNHLHFSNLYALPALSFSLHRSSLSSRPPRPSSRALFSNREFQLLETPVSYRKQRIGTPSNREKTPFLQLRTVPSLTASRSRPRGHASRFLIYGSGIKTRMRRASSSRASNASRGTSRPTNREPGAKLLRALIYGSGIRSRMRRASSSRASNASRGIPPPPTREPRAKLLRTLIYGNGINFPRKSLKTKDRHHA